MQIGNFTPDAIQWKHVGIAGWIHPGEVKEFDNRRGNHIMTGWGRRGLVIMEYNDPDKDPDYKKRKKAESLQQYLDFWTRQIEVFNQQNEQTKNEGRPYNRPTKQLEDKAKELQIEILGPWQLRTPVHSPDIKRLEAENAELRGMLNRMNTVLEKLQAAQDATEIQVDDWEPVKNKFMYLSATQLPKWVRENKAQINVWPEHMLDVLTEKWEKMIGEPFDPTILS